MSTTTITRHETAARFLAALAGRADPDEYLELRYRLDDGQRMGQLFDRPARLRRLATRAIALGRRTDVYVGCAPRTRRHGGRDAVERAFVLWADCDGDAAVAALEHFEPAPSIIIASGTGSNCHAYWLLSQPLPRDELERANRRLAHALGADLASADAARILRVPGTRSRKHDPPTAVDAIRLDSHRRFSAGDVIAALADPPAPPSRPSSIAPVEQRGDDPLLAIAPEVYVHRLLGVDVPRHRKVPCPFHDDRQASLHVYETAEARLVLLRALPARRHDLRPRRAAVRLHGPRRGLSASARRAAPALRTRGAGMNDPSGWHAFNYVHADIADGMAIEEWRRRRAAERMAARTSARAARRCRRRRWLLRWIRPWRVPTPRWPVRGRPAHG